MKELEKETRTMILYEAPHRLSRTLKELYEALGDREVSICKELTKTFEQVFQATLKAAVSRFETEEARGEQVIVIAGKRREELKAEKEESWMRLSLHEHMDYYLAQGVERKEAMRMVAKDRGIPKREVYQGLL